MSTTDPTNVEYPPTSFDRTPQRWHGILYLQRRNLRQIRDVFVSAFPKDPARKPLTLLERTWMMLVLLLNCASACDSLKWILYNATGAGPKGPTNPEYPDGEVYEPEPPPILDYAGPDVPQAPTIPPPGPAKLGVAAAVAVVVGSGGVVIYSYYTTPTGPTGPKPPTGPATAPSVGGGGGSTGGSVKHTPGTADP